MYRSERSNGMKGQKSSGIRAKVLYDLQKRVLAFLLSVAMILTNIGAGANAAYAADSSDNIVFTMYGTQLLEAIEEAIFSKNEVAADEFDFTNGKISEFENLFYENGKIYEAFPALDGGNINAELRIFVRLPEDIDEKYNVTGDEDIIFLYVNNGADTISCSTEIIRMVDGEEKVKKISPVKVKSYEAAFGDEELDIISKPIEDIAEPTENESQEETLKPVDDETAIAPDESATTEPEESTTEEQIEETSATEIVEEKTQETEEAEDESEVDESEAEASEAGEAEVSTEPVASIIRHLAPVVADHEEGDAAEAPKANDETEALAPEKEAPVEPETPTEVEPTETITESPVTTEADESSSDETTTAAESKKDETTPAIDESYTDSSESTADIPETAEPFPTEETTEAQVIKDNESKVETHDLVGIGYCSTAKVYMTSLNKLKVMDDKVVISTTADDGAEITVSGYSQAMENIAFVNAECLDDVGGFIEKINAELAPSGQTIDKIAVYDVTVIDNDGNETQPNNEVKVTIKAPEIVSNDVNVGAFHAKELAEDDQEYEIEIKDVAVNKEQGTVTMGTDSFSPVGAFSLMSASGSSTAYNSWEDNSWKTEPIIIEPVTDGIELSFESLATNYWEHKGVIRVEIGESVNADKLNINMGSIVNAALSGTNYQPGDEAELQLEIINNSSYDYKYTNNSLAFTIIPKGEDSGYRSFTGQIVPKGNTEVWRTGNSALRELFNYDQYTRFKVNEITDEKLGKKLITNNYDNGIADLPKYYLDYYNEKYGSDAGQLDALPDEAIADIWGAGNIMYNDPCNTSGKRPDESDTNRETVRELTELGYNYFYNSILTLRTDDYTGDKNPAPEVYSLGSHMRSYNNNGTTVIEPYFEGSFSQVPAGSDITMSNQIIIKMHGDHATNAYMVQDFGFTFGFQLQKPTQEQPPVPPTPPGGGGNSGGGGGTTPTGGHRTTPETNGPGITIEPEAVPLASLPETILEEEVPLAPLPKTGQGLNMSILMMMLSGIVLVFTAIGRKRKEF